MAVIPIGARLDDREFVGESRARLDAGKGDAGHAVHLERQEQPVPVDRAVLIQRILDVQPDLLPLAQPDQRPGDGAVDPDGMALAAVDRHHLVRNAQMNVLARDFGQRTGDPARLGLRPCREPWREREPASCHRRAAQQLAAIDPARHFIPPRALRRLLWLRERLPYPSRTAGFACDTEMGPDTVSGSIAEKLSGRVASRASVAPGGAASRLPSR